jgi:hypothetical protein
LAVFVQDDDDGSDAESEAAPEEEDAVLSEPEDDLDITALMEKAKLSQ